MNRYHGFVDLNTTFGALLPLQSCWVLYICEAIISQFQRVSYKMKEISKDITSSKEELPVPVGEMVVVMMVPPWKAYFFGAVLLGL